LHDEINAPNPQVLLHSGHSASRFSLMKSKRHTASVHCYGELRSWPTLAENRSINPISKSVFFTLKEDKVRGYRSKFFIVIVVLLLTMALVVPIQAQSSDPSISVSDQVTTGTVWVATVYSVGPGFVVISSDSGRGTPAQVMGYTAVGPGWSYNVPVQLNAGLATSKLWATLHTDDGTVGTFEFGVTGGADAAVKVGDQIVQQSFFAPLIDMADQFVADNTVTANTVTVAVPGWLVIHADGGGKPGPVLGETLLKAGRNKNVSVTLSADGQTPVLWPMLHVDDNGIGTYEFGTVQGADAPVKANGAVATASIWTVPHVRMADQIATPGDANKQADAGAPTVVVKSVLSQGPGFIVIHADGGGKPGPVAGYAAVDDGLNTDVEVTLDKGDVTPILWPMLHVDDNTVGTYEFGTVQGADAPVKDASGNVITFPINAAPTLVMDSQELADNTLTIKEALIDAPGWIAIHQNADGKPGPVIATYPLLPGVNSNAVITVDPAKAGDQVFPMLHYDTGEIGKYEFGTVDKTDLPVSVDGNVVVAPLSLAGAASTGSTTAAAAASCTVTPAGQTTVNKRSSASTSGNVVGGLTPGESADVVGQAQSASGATWLSLSDGSWVRADVVKQSGDCSNLPTVQSSAPPAEPATTPEPGS
jgi:hypothetical protein